MKQGDVLLRFLFNFVLDCPIVKVIIMWQRLKFWGAHQCLVRADDVKLLGEIDIYTPRKHRSLISCR